MSLWEAAEDHARYFERISGDILKVQRCAVFYNLDEGEYEEFATRGAKKYVCRKHGKLTATISGVSTREDGGRISGGMELEAAGGVKAFLKPVFEFKEAGGVELKYNDRKRFMVRIDGHDLKIRECVTIAPSTYRLSDTDEYSDLLTLTRSELREYLFDAFGRRI